MRGRNSTQEPRLPLVLRNHRIAFLIVPKVASSSVLMALYELDHGRPWQDFVDRDGVYRHIHNGWFGIDKTAPLPRLRRQGYFVFCIVRDPVDRFLSAYASRVLGYRELSAEKMQLDVAEKYGLAPDPDLPTFISSLDQYRQANREVWRHTRPQADYLGHDLSMIDMVFRFESDLGAIPGELSEIAGHPINMPHIQRSPVQIGREALSEESLRKVTVFCEPDYRLLSNYYKPPKICLTL